MYLAITSSQGKSSMHFAVRCGADGKITFGRSLVIARYNDSLTSDSVAVTSDSVAVTSDSVPM